MSGTLLNYPTATVSETIRCIKNEVEVLSDDTRLIVLAAEHTAPCDTFEGAFEVYAAVYTNASPEERVYGVVIKVTRTPQHLTFKIIDEENNPYERKCPTRILDFLTPTRNPWALSWRDDCLNNTAPIVTAFNAAE